METPTEDFETFIPGIPSLFHLAVVKIAIPFFNDFGIETLKSAYLEITRRRSVRLSQTQHKPDSCKISRAKTQLLFIPAHLRHSVLTAVMAMHYATNRWKDYNSCLINLENIEFIFYWRHDGSVDSIKTVQQLVLNANINIKERFNLACLYCLEKSILALWEEMKACDKTEYIETTTHQEAVFWVKWIAEGACIPWLQAISRHYRKFRLRDRVPNCFSFFPLLSPEERWPFFYFFQLSPIEDAKLCLYALTDEEKEDFLRMCKIKLLILYLQWPLQSVFLEKFKKLLPYMNENEFCVILHLIWLNHECELFKKNDFDYYNLFLDAWNASPPYFRESADKDYFLKQDLDSCFNKKRPKRKDFNSDSNQKKRVRKNGK